MSNWFRLTPDGSLDRQYLRICAVYRCYKRYGAAREQCITKLREVGVRNPKRLTEIWDTVKDG